VLFDAGEKTVAIDEKGCQRAVHGLATLHPWDIRVNPEKCSFEHFKENSSNLDCIEEPPAENSAEDGTLSP
jgi:hypothetical protein